MAKELSRTFDTKAGAVHVRVQDEAIGNESLHTIYVAGVEDIEATVADILLNTEAAAQKLHARMTAAGWKPSGV